MDSEKYGKRPVFTVSNSPPFFVEKQIDFVFHCGLSLAQNQKTIKSLHEAYSLREPHQRILEISSKSENELGVNLSAFNLMIETKEQKNILLKVSFRQVKCLKKVGLFLTCLA